MYHAWDLAGGNVPICQTFCSDQFMVVFVVNFEMDARLAGPECWRT